MWMDCGPCCAVFDEDSARVIAYSRIVGINRYCVDPNLNKPKSELKKEAGEEEEEESVAGTAGGDKRSKAAAVKKPVKVLNCQDLPRKAIELGVPCL